MYHTNVPWVPMSRPGMSDEVRGGPGRSTLRLGPANFGGTWRRHGEAERSPGDGPGILSEQTSEASVNEPVIDQATGLMTTRCAYCGHQIWQRSGHWADSPVKGMSGKPLVVNMICPAPVPAPLQHEPVTVS